MAQSMLRIFALYASTSPKLRPSLENPSIAMPATLLTMSSFPTSSGSTRTLSVPWKGLKPSLDSNCDMYLSWQM